MGNNNNINGNQVKNFTQSGIADNFIKSINEQKQKKESSFAEKKSERLQDIKNLIIGTKKEEIEVKSPLKINGKINNKEQSLDELRLAWINKAEVINKFIEDMGEIDIKFENEIKEVITKFVNKAEDQYKRKFESQENKDYFINLLCGYSLIDPDGYTRKEDGHQIFESNFYNFTVDNG